MHGAPDGSFVNTTLTVSRFESRSLSEVMMQGFNYHCVKASHSQFTGRVCLREIVSRHRLPPGLMSRNIDLITEDGMIKSRPDPGGPERIGPSVYSGMTTVLSASTELATSLVLEKDKELCLYVFNSVIPKALLSLGQCMMMKPRPYRPAMT